MAKVDAEKAAKIGDFLFRYMRARHRFKQTLESPLPDPSELLTDVYVTE